MSKRDFRRYRFMLFWYDKVQVLSKLLFVQLWLPTSLTSILIMVRRGLLQPKTDTIQKTARGVA